MALSTEAAEISDVPVVPCEQAHDNEVFATWTLDLAAFPGAASVREAAISGCRDRFRGSVGFPMELTSLDISALWPTEASWEQEDRDVVCLLFSFDGAKLVGSRIGLADGTDQSVFRLRVGDCFDAPLRDPSEGTEVEGVVLLDCALPHFAEVYETFTLPPGPYPGRGPLGEEAQARCLDAYEPAIGQPFDDSALWFNALPPTESSWDAGDREVLCYVYDLLNGKIIGAARSWALAQRDDVAAFGDGYDLDGIAAGQCIDDPLDDTIPVVDCVEAHDNEVFHVVELPAGPWPGREALTAAIKQECDPALESWVGPDRDDLTWFSFQPVEAMWVDGDRRIACALYDVDFLPLEGSQKQEPV